MMDSSDIQNIEAFPIHLRGSKSLVVHHHIRKESEANVFIKCLYSYLWLSLDIIARIFKEIYRGKKCISILD